MYLVAIHVPVFRDGARLFVATDWGRSLVLLRDSLQGRLGELTVVAPERPFTAAKEQMLTATSELGPDIKVVGVFDGQSSPQKYWLSERAKWLTAVRHFSRHARVVHTGMNDLYRPINLDALRVAVASPAQVVFVRDTDEVQKALDFARNESGFFKMKTNVYNSAYTRAMRWAVAHADLSLLKGKSLMRRYASYAKNAHIFQDTSYSQADVISNAQLTARLQVRRQGSTLRLVYCGRLVDRKGVDDSLRAVARAKELGAHVRLDLIGEGDEREALRLLADRLGLENEVRFLRNMPYGSALLRKLRDYDALLFTPKAEDTPRMIFDAYAAGLPLLGYQTTYNQERAEEDRAARLVPMRDFRSAGEMLTQLVQSRQMLDELSQRAREAGLRHCTEHWYAQRAQLTFQMAQLPLSEPARELHRVPA